MSLNPVYTPQAQEGLSGSRRMQGLDMPTRAGQSGELVFQRGQAWEVPSSRLSVPVGLEQVAAGQMKCGLQAQREGWRSSAAQGEGGTHHDFGES